MAHSRPSTVRSHSPPPKSPARNSHHDRPSHHRRKSGQIVVSERKSSRPAPPNRRTTPQFATKVSPGGKNMGKSDRDSRHFEDEDFRLSGEGFLQYCPSCEKQINPHDSFSMLYCSEACRKQDLQSTSTNYNNPTYNSYAPQYSPPMSPYPTRYTNYDSMESGPDIIPQFSPTQSTSRPRSYFNSAPLPQPSNSPPSPKSDYSYKSSTPTSKTTKRHSGSSTALASLRELAVALPTTRDRDSRRNSRDKDRKREYSPSTIASISSPPTPLSHSNTGVWNYLPRTLSMASVYSRDIVSASQAERYPGASGSPGNSYNGYGYGYGDYQYAVVKPQGLLPPVSLGMDRPLPSRSYGGRPRSVDLVTPISYAES